MKKLILYIFIPVLAVLLMSHNVFAFSITQNVDIIQLKNQPYVSFLNGSTWTTYSRGAIDFTNSSDKYTQMRLKKDDFFNVNFSVGDYVVLNGFFSANKATFVDSNNAYVIGGFIGSNPQFVNCSIIDFHFGSVQEYNQVSSSSGELWYRADFQLTCKIVSSAFNDNPTINFRLNPDIFNVSGANTKLNISFNNAIFATPSSNINQEQEQATQDAANNSRNSGNTSQNNSQNATSSLLSVFTGFASVITNASASNCVINAPLNSSFGSENFNVDLCALSLPPAIGALTSIIAVMVIVPFAISMFNKFIGIMESFQR